MPTAVSDVAELKIAKTNFSPALLSLAHLVVQEDTRMPTLLANHTVQVDPLDTRNGQGLTAQPNPWCPGYQLLMGKDARLQIDYQGRDQLISFHGDNMSYLDKHSKQAIGGQKDSPGGSRFLEPWPQSWSWPPPSNLTHGPLNLQDVQLSNGSKAITAELSEQKQLAYSQHYGCIPSSLMTIQPDGSFLLGFQQQLATDSIEGKAAWWVAPLVTRDEENPLAGEAQVLFPASPNELPNWLRETGTEGRWAWDPVHQFVTVRSGEFLETDEEKLTTASTSWAMMGKPGDSQVLLLQSQSRHPDHFQLYGLNGETPYLEVEWTGPRKHKAGERSELVVKGQWVPLASLDLPFAYLAEGQTLTQQLTLIGEAVQRNLQVVQPVINISDSSALFYPLRSTKPLLSS